MLKCDSILHHSIAYNSMKCFTLSIVGGGKLFMIVPYRCFTALKTPKIQKKKWSSLNLESLPHSLIINQSIGGAL